MRSTLNVAAYRFVALERLTDWRSLLLEQATELELRGTVLLAEEGINLFLAGRPPAVQAWLQWLQRHEPFAGLQIKQSWSEGAPFQRLRVRIKREIIRMNQPMVSPLSARAPSVSAATLRRWLDHGHDDAGRPLAMLDTRNRFEVQAGRFEGAMHWDLQRFSEFPAALRAKAHELQGKTVVSYCTGGIRCEKAALAMRDAGISHAYQLDGGILQYFDDIPGAPHWHGRCVVFDERGSLDCNLQAA